jgi:hypothetical protein
MRGSGGGARDHPLCSFAACVPPKDWSAEDVRCVGLRERVRDGGMEAMWMTLAKIFWRALFCDFCIVREREH